MHHMPQEHPDSTASALTAVTASYEGGGLRARSGSAQARCTCCHFCSYLRRTSICNGRCGNLLGNGHLVKRQRCDGVLCACRRCARWRRCCRRRRWRLPWTSCWLPASPIPTQTSARQWFRRVRAHITDCEQQF